MRFRSPPKQEDYYAQVWDLVQQIPYAKVATYGQIAKMRPPPQRVEIKAYRAYGPRRGGGAMATCPESVPWQRVINAKGEISKRPGAQRQKELLLEEGVMFNDKGRIDLQKYGWSGSDQADEPRQESLF